MPCSAGVSSAMLLNDFQIWKQLLDGIMSTEASKQEPVNHVFVDLENVKTVEVSVFERKNMTFHLILGPSNGKLDVGLVEKLVEHAAAVRMVRSPQQGANAADFVLAYHLGQAVLAEPKAHFHIVSKDKGFDSLVMLLKSRQVKVRRHDTWESLDLSAAPKSAEASTVPAVQVVPRATQVSSPQASEESKQTRDRALSEDARKVLASLRKAEKNRPKMRATLVRHVQNGGGKECDEKKAEKLVKELFSQGFLTDSGAGKLEYRL